MLDLTLLRMLAASPSHGECMRDFIPRSFNVVLENQIFQSVTFIALVILARVLFFYFITRNSAILSENQRLWMARARSLSWLIIALGLVAIWWTQLSHFALSIAAVAVALVIATKELILCFSGSLMRAASGSFSVGDRIEIGPYRGEVIDYNWFSTTLQEMDKIPNFHAFTGRTVQVPNSLFLSNSVKILKFSKRYVFHRFDLVIEPGVNIYDLAPWIIDEINMWSADFTEVAKRYNAFIEKRTGIDIPGAEPRVMMSTNDKAKHVITIVVFCPTQSATELEQHITRVVMEEIYQRMERSFIKIAKEAD